MASPLQGRSRAPNIPAPSTRDVYIFAAGQQFSPYQFFPVGTQQYTVMYVVKSTPSERALGAPETMAFSQSFAVGTPAANVVYEMSRLRAAINAGHAWDSHVMSVSNSSILGSI